MEIVVVGAGVIGLSVAVCLAQRGHQVEVGADREAVDTTSAVFGEDLYRRLGGWRGERDDGWRGERDG